MRLFHTRVADQPLCSLKIQLLSVWTRGLKVDREKGDNRADSDNRKGTIDVAFCHCRFLLWFFRLQAFKNEGFSLASLKDLAPL